MVLSQLTNVGIQASIPDPTTKDRSRGRTALTWALEMGEVSRFRSIAQAISYGGLRGDEKSSAEMVLRTPLSKAFHEVFSESHAH